MSLTYADVRKILSVLESTEQCDYVEFAVGDFTVQAGDVPASAELVRTPPAAAQPAAAAAPAVAPTVSETAVVEVPDNMVAVQAPMAGAFYITPSPDEPAFVEEGGHVESGETVCLVEVMKLFSTITAPVSGTVHKICVEHGATVALDQVVLIIEPDA